MWCAVCAVLKLPVCPNECAACGHVGLRVPSWKGPLDNSTPKNEKTILEFIGYSLPGPQRQCFYRLYVFDRAIPIHSFPDG